MIMEKEKEDKQKNRAVCDHCGSKFVYVRLRDEEVVCRMCGHVSELKKEEEN